MGWPCSPLTTSCHQAWPSVSEAGSSIVNCPTRWPLLLLIGYLCWSSSWRWQPHIRGCRLLYPLPRAGMRFLTQFFCKMYFLYILSCRKSKKQHFFAIFNPQKMYFLWTPWGQVATLPDLRFHQGRTSNLAKRCPLLFTTLPLCQIWGSIRQNLKSNHHHQQGWSSSTSSQPSRASYFYSSFSASEVSQPPSIERPQIHFY